MERQSEVLALLRAARELLSDERRWTKQTMARDRWGITIKVDSTAAASFCSLGAIERSKTFDEDALVACEALEQVIYDHQQELSVSEYNDHDKTTHADVLDRFDEAIALVESGTFDPSNYC